MSMYYGIDPNGYSDFVFVGLALLAGFAMSCLMTRFFQAPLNGKDLLISQATVDLLNINQNSKNIVFVDEAELRGKKEKIRLYTDLANI